VLEALTPGIQTTTKTKMATNILTVNTGINGPGAVYIQSIYNALMKNPPPGYTVLQHQTIGDLCEQLAQAGQMLGVAEIISHANPYYLGVIQIPAVPQLAQALRMASPIAKVFMSGCNTGTCMSASNTFCISTYLASMVPCQVYGSMGYIINAGTYAQGNVVSAPSDSPGDTVFCNAYSKQVSGSAVFQQKPRSSMPRFVVPFPPNTPININDPRLPGDQKSVLTNVIGLIQSMPNQNIAINGQSAPNYTVAAGGDYYDFFGNGETIRRESNGATYVLTLDAKTQSILSSVAMPMTTTAVVQQPVAAPKVAT
jgi:hypothetical protein